MGVRFYFVFDEVGENCTKLFEPFTANYAFEISRFYDPGRRKAIF